LSPPGPLNTAPERIGRIESLSDSPACRTASANMWTAHSKPQYRLRALWFGHIAFDTRLRIPLDHVGPLTRRVEDLALVQTVVDPAGFGDISKSRRRKFVLGHDPAFYAAAHKDVLRSIRSVLDVCRDLGAEIREVGLPKPDEVLRIHGVIFAAESTAYHMDHFSQYRDQYPKIALDMFDLAERTRGFEYVRAVRDRAALTSRLLRLYDELDFVLLPTFAVLTPYKSTDTIPVGSRDVDFTMALIRYTCLFDHTGQPVVAMPSSAIRPGVATSIQVIGSPYRDAETVAFASRLEHALGLDIDLRVTV
jgi:Asp-tRNA(Asn)/Glu-tRNA(Gln) amidotransferase A subunit family amidase